MGTFAGHADKQLLADIRNRLSYDPVTGVVSWKTAICGRWPAGRPAIQNEQHGYCCVRINKKRFFAHQVAWFLHTGNWPVDQIDHKNCNRSDNRWENLRSATQSQNNANRALRNDCKAGLKGVQRRATGYVARCSGTYLGIFLTAEEAHQAYLAEAEKRFGCFARAS